MSTLQTVENGKKEKEKERELQTHGCLKEENKYRSAIQRQMTIEQNHNTQ